MLPVRVVLVFTAVAEVAHVLHVDEWAVEAHPRQARLVAAPLAVVGGAAHEPRADPGHDGYAHEGEQYGTQGHTGSGRLVTRPESGG